MQQDINIQLAANALERARWHSCQDEGAPNDKFDWYYAENKIYVIRNKAMKSYNFIRAKSPKEAWEKLEKQFLSQKLGTEEKRK